MNDQAHPPDNNARPRSPRTKLLSQKTERATEAGRPEQLVPEGEHYVSNVSLHR
jgi:hypothetical protein